MTIKVRSKNLCSVAGRFPKCTEHPGTGECVHRDGLMYSCNWKAPYLTGRGLSGACANLEAIEDALDKRNESIRLLSADAPHCGAPQGIVSDMSDGLLSDVEKEGEQHE